ncbi:MAG TPA: PA3371 family protein [Pseudomonas sp.]|uniref:PA3371 family protein n=1 Tax=Pseudomonas sp. TaxID=306 RepID=UPI002ED78A3E
MSKAALSFFILTVMALAVDQLLPTTMETMGTIAKSAAALFAGLFVIGLVIGRKIKFDPVLR